MKLSKSLGAIYRVSGTALGAPLKQWGKPSLKTPASKHAKPDHAGN
jgi:hypothetical protein